MKNIIIGAVSAIAIMLITEVYVQDKGTYVLFEKGAILNTSTGEVFKQEIFEKDKWEKTISFK